VGEAVLISKNGIDKKLSCDHPGDVEHSGSLDRSAAPMFAAGYRVKART